MNFLTIALTIISLIIIIIGIIGIFIPIIPGVILLFLGSFLLGYTYDYKYLGTGSLTAIFIISVLGFFLDYISGILGAKYVKAGKKSVTFSFFGTIIGCFLPPLGLIIGPVFGAILGEFYENKNLIKSGKVGLATFIGMCLGLISKVTCALIILLIIIYNHISLLMQ